MMSDWAFYAISLKEGGSFWLEYGGDFETFQSCSLAFSIFGLLLWLPDLYAYILRSSEDDVVTESLNFTILMTLTVMGLEDIPQVKTPPVLQLLPFICPCAFVALDVAGTLRGRLLRVVRQMCSSIGVQTCSI